MQTVLSDDGTEIAYERHGSGRPLILVHGGSTTRRTWNAVRPHLTDRFELYLPDRRGRGDSGDGDDYSLQREVEDVRALVDAVDGDPILFGHSFGGLVAFAAALDCSLSGLALYEPAILVGDHRGDDLASRMAARLADGDRRGALRLFLEDAGGVPDVSMLPWWPDEAPLHLVETVVRENREVEAYQLPDDPTVDVPTLLLTGEHGPERLRDSTHALDDRLADSRLVELDGQGHLATEAAPQLVAEALSSMVEEPVDA